MRRITLKSMSVEQQMTVFLPMVCLLALLCGVLAVSYHRAKTPVNSDRPQTAPVQPVVGERAVLVCICRTPTLLVSVLEIDPLGGKVFIHAFDTENLSADGGAAAVCEAVSQKLSMTVSQYVEMTPAQLHDFLKICGNIAVYFSETLEFTDSAGMRVAYPAGRVSLTPALVRQLLFFAPLVSQHTVWQEVVCGIAAYVFSSGRDMHAVYTALTQTVHTNLRIYDFTAYLPTLEAMAGAPCICVSELSKE